MRLIFIYGPPASGKLTVAEKLSDSTSISVFHNHLTRDLVNDIYKKELLSHYGLVTKIRFDVLEYCAKNNTDLIFTYVYGGEQDDKDVRDFTDVIESNGGEIIFVELTASKEDLIDRVGNESRKKYNKLTDESVMNSMTEDLDLYKIPYVDSLKINTSESNPNESAKTIVRHLNR